MPRGYSRTSTSLTIRARIPTGTRFGNRRSGTTRWDGPSKLGCPFRRSGTKRPDGPQVWGLNLFRRRIVAGETSHFSLESRKKRGIASQFGDLEDVRVPTSIRRIEARPYVLSSFHSGPAAEGDPFFDGDATGARVGSDFRLGLGSVFTLDATVNPDFGQVDADPAVINLTAFESFFPEQRPFFVEDAQVFDFGLSGGQNKLFYSRRIGRSPHGGAPSDADYSNIPAAATILGAAKVTRRTKRGLSLGGLAAVTQAESGEAFFSSADQLDQFRVEPRTEFGALSARQDFNSGMSQVGALFSALHRSLPPDSELDFLPDQAFSGGLRFDHQWSDRTWKLAGFLAGSRVQGSPEALLAIQRASNHYFQRPDGTRAQVDSAAISMTGAEWRVQLDRQNSEHWTGSVWTAGVTRGFEVNDVGFSRNRERLDGGLRAGYRELNPGRILRQYSFNFTTFYNFSWEAFDDPGSWSSWQSAYTNGTFNLGSQITLLNYKTANLNLSFRPGPVQPHGHPRRTRYDSARKFQRWIPGRIGPSPTHQLPREPELFPLLAGQWVQNVRLRRHITLRPSPARAGLGQPRVQRAIGRVAVRPVYVHSPLRADLRSALPLRRSRTQVPFP